MEYSPWNSPGQNTGVGSLSLLQGMFPTQGLNPGLPHCRQILYQLSHQGSTQWMFSELNWLHMSPSQCWGWFGKSSWWSESESCSVQSESLQPHGLYSPGQTTGVGSLSLLQGMFPTQGSNPGLWHCRRILNQLSHKGSPRILEWVACPFSSGSSWPRNQTRVSFTASGFFTNWAIWKAPHHRRWEGKSRKLRDTWSNRQIEPWCTKWSKARVNRVLPREHTGHSKHPLPTIQEKTLHMDIIIWSIPKSDWLCSLQSKMEKLYTVSKN